MGTLVNTRYRALPEDLFHPDLGSYHSFSIVYEEQSKDNSWIVSRKIEDVTDSFPAVSSLVRLLNEGRLSPCHMRETIENWLGI